MDAAGSCAEVGVFTVHVRCSLDTDTGLARKVVSTEPRASWCSAPGSGGSIAAVTSCMVEAPATTPPGASPTAAAEARLSTLPVVVAATCDPSCELTMIDLATSTFGSTTHLALKGHKAPVTTVAGTELARCVLSCDSTGLVRMWRCSRRQEDGALTASCVGVVCPSMELAPAVSLAWVCVASEPAATLPSRAVASCSFVATGHSDGTLRLWSCKPGSTSSGCEPVSEYPAMLHGGGGLHLSAAGHVGTATVLPTTACGSEVWRFWRFELAKEGGSSAKPVAPSLAACVDFPAVELPGRLHQGCALITCAPWSHALRRMLAVVPASGHSGHVTPRRPAVCALCLTDSGLHVVGSDYGPQPCGRVEPPLPTGVSDAPKEERKGNVGASPPQPPPRVVGREPPSAAALSSRDVLGLDATASGTLSHRFLLPPRKAEGPEGQGSPPQHAVFELKHSQRRPRGGGSRPAADRRSMAASEFVERLGVLQGRVVAVERDVAAIRKSFTVFTEDVHHQMNAILQVLRQLPTGSLHHDQLDGSRVA